jgi:hypothetical protein
MQAVIADSAILDWTLALALAGAAVLVWRWRRGVATRRISKGLRAYATGDQVLS